MKTHWLYGRGPKKELEFVKEIDEETACTRCFHFHICQIQVEARCVNFQFGTSEHRGCGGCLHRFTRYDKDSVPCFHCDDFVDRSLVQIQKPKRGAKRGT